MSNYIFNCISFSLSLHLKIHLPSFIKFIPHHPFRFKRINKLNGVDDFSYEIGYTTECNGDLSCNATTILPVFSS